MSAPCLLIIDDQPTSISLLTAYLAEQGFDIRVATDGRDGLKKAFDGKPDLILLDVVMDHMDGFEVCRQLKQNPHTDRVPIIFLSASDYIEDKLQGFSCGAVDYITKPFAEAEVLARVSLQLRTQQELARLSTLSGNQVTLSHEQSDRDEAILKIAVGLLVENIDNPPGLIELAHMSGTNTQRLTEIFRRKVGLTVFDYLQEIRLEAARRMLVDSQCQIQLISSRIGYRNPGDFSRAFRRRYGIGPREFRNMSTGIGNSTESQPSTG